MARLFSFLIPVAITAWFCGCPPDTPGPQDDDTSWWDDDAADDDSWPGPDDDDTWPDDDVGDDDTGSADDADGDGYTVEEGDCNDHDPTVNPGEADVCDEEDNDCDALMNEDSQAYDQYEPDNDVDGYDLGDLTDSVDTVNSFIHGPGDSDRWVFFVEDEYFDWFGIDIELSVPSGVDLALELLWIEDIDGIDQGLVAEADDGNQGINEAIEYGGTAGDDDTGIYEVVVIAESGFNCNVPYVLVIDP